MIPHSSPTSSYLSPMTDHLHIDGDTCPWCEQEIPPEKLEEISGRIAAKQREQTQAITAQLEKRYEIDKAQADAKARAELELERQQSAAREATAREEAKKAAEVVAAQQLAAAETSRQELQAALQQQKADANAARLTAEQVAADATAQLEQLRQETEAAQAAAKVEAERREAEIRSEAQQVADAAAAEKLAAAEAGRQELETALQQQKVDADAARLAAEQAAADATAQLKQLRQETEAAQAAAKVESERREAEIRSEAQHAADAAAAEKLAVAEAGRHELEAALQQQKADAAAARLTAEQAAADATAQLEQLRQENEVAQAAAKIEAERREAEIRAEALQAAQAEAAAQLAANSQALADAQAKAAEDLNAQREVLEKAKEDALNVERAKTFDETQKLSNKVNELQRTLDQKTADELGEGAEVDLYEALRAEFPDDKIDRVGKGVPGGDVLHVVMHNGRECGTIIYDSKNHKAFRNDHVTKLLADQIAAKAEHAILSTHKFPRGTGQLHNQDGVLLANPARVVALVTLIRQHMVQTHTLRLSSAERESKTAALYEFIVSEQCTQYFARLDNCAGELLELQVKEKKQHEATWKKQGETLRLIQKVQADLSNRISSIIGTAADVDDEPELLEAAQ